MTETNKNKQSASNRQRDINRLTKETTNKVFSVLTEAMKQIEGERTSVDTIADSQLYCDMRSLMGAAFARVIKHDRKCMQYKDMDMQQLLEQLYRRMQMMYHYTECKGRELKGIAWAEEKGRFVIRLSECAINMEHSICDECRLPGWEGSIRELTGTLFAIGYDPDKDPDDPNGLYYQHYQERLNFCCALNTDDPDNVEYRDVILYHRSWQHKDLLRDTLASLDMISDMNNEKTEK